MQLIQATKFKKAARIDRNNIFYTKGTGMLDLVKLTKAYIKSL